MNISVARHKCDDLEFERTHDADSALDAIILSWNEGAGKFQVFLDKWQAEEKKVKM